MEYLIAHNLQEAVRLRKATGFALLAGGTDLYPALESGRRIKGLIDISRVQALQGAPRLEGAGWVIPALTTWEQLCRAELPPLFDALKQAAGEIGGQQIQNTGTLGGNICNASPAADGSCVLSALDAVVIIIGPSGRRELPFASFVTGNRLTGLAPDELVGAIRIPACSGRHGSVFRKLGARRYLVISIVMVCAAIEVDMAGVINRARIAVGACADRPVRLTSFEQRLQGVTLDQWRELAAPLPTDLSALSPQDDIRGSAEYRLSAAGTMIADALDELAQRLRI